MKQWLQMSGQRLYLVVHKVIHAMFPSPCPLFCSILISSPFLPKFLHMVLTGVINFKILLKIRQDGHC